MRYIFEKCFTTIPHHTRLDVYTIQECDSIPINTYGNYQVALLHLEHLPILI